MNKTQAVIVRNALSCVPASVEEIRDSINAAGHDFGIVRGTIGLASLMAEWPADLRVRQMPEGRS